MGIQRSHSVYETVLVWVRVCVLLINNNKEERTEEDSEVSSILLQYGGAPLIKIKHTPPWGAAHHTLLFAIALGLL